MCVCVRTLKQEEVKFGLGVFLCSRGSLENLKHFSGIIVYSVYILIKLWSPNNPGNRLPLI